MFLITYQCVKDNGKREIGYACASNPENWLEDVQHYEGETFFIINTLEISYNWWERNNGKLKGM